MNAFRRLLLFFGISCSLLTVLVQAQSESEPILPKQILEDVDKSRHFLNLNPDSSFFYAKKVLDYSEMSEHSVGLGLAKNLIGEIFYLQGAYNQSIAYLLESSEHFEQAKYLQGTAQNHIALGVAYQYSLRLETALEHFTSGLQIYTDLDDQTGIALAYGNLGHYYEKKEQYDSAFFYQRKALRLYERLRDDAGMAIIYDNIGSIYEDLGQYEEAYDYFMQSAKYDSISDNHAALVISMNNIGDSYRKRKQYRTALEYTTRALALAKTLGLNYQIRSAYRDFAKTYSNMGESLLAFQYMDSIYNLNEIVFSNQIASQIANLQTLHDMQQKEQEIALLESRQRIERNTRNSIIAGGAGLITFAAILIFQLRARNEKKRKFFEAEKALDQAKLKNILLKEKALQTELVNKQLREEQLHVALELRSKELTAKALHIIQKNKLLRELKAQLHAIQKDSKDKTKSKELKRLAGLIDYGFHFDKDWQEFESTFEQVHSGFFANLRKMCPNLTASELRLCALLRLNLNSKDMAAILAISQDSLRIARYRLRKKIGLQRGDNLTNHIIRL